MARADDDKKSQADGQKCPGAWLGVGRDQQLTCRVGEGIAVASHNAGEVPGASACQGNPADGHRGKGAVDRAREQRVGAAGHASERELNVIGPREQVA